MTTLRTQSIALTFAGLLTVALLGCSSPATDAGSEPAGGTSAEETAPEEAGTDETATDESSGGDGDIEVIGGDLASSTAVLLAETYAKGRDPQPTVEFLDATTVRFAFPEGVDELGNCQIAYGALSGEGIRVLIAAGANEFDCTAEVEG